jgi:hypothetical protein
MVDMEVIVRRQDHEHCASITCMIRHYVARRAKVIFDHSHNADDRKLRATARRRWPFTTALINSASRRAKAALNAFDIT